MERHVTDEMVETVAVVGTHKEIAGRVRDRYAGVCSGVEFSIPVESPEDGGCLSAMLGEIQAG